MDIIPLPKNPIISSEKDSIGTIEIHTIFPGYGITLGNALRRVLISSLRGSVITSVKIKGVKHEFSTIPYIMEDVVAIILNLKQVRFKTPAESEHFNAALSVKGEKVVKAGDIKPKGDVEVLNKDLVIATLTDKKADLEMDIEISKGFGYETVEKRKNAKLEVGTIALDAMYSPVLAVNFKVENMRVGDKTDYNRIIFDIETDGSITPKDAFKQAAQILKDQFNELTVFAGEVNLEIAPETPVAEKKETEAPKKEKEKDATKIKLSDTDISSRIMRILEENGVKTIGGLVRKSKEDILEFEGMGQKGIEEINGVLKKFNLSLKQ